MHRVPCQRQLDTTEERECSQTDLGLGSHRRSKFVEVDGPVLALGLLTLFQFRWVKRNVLWHTAVEDDGSSVLVKEGLDANDFVSLVE